jgi:hypothetical protein
MHDGRMPTCGAVPTFEACCSAKPRGRDDAQTFGSRSGWRRLDESGACGVAACHEILRTSEPPDYPLSFTSVSGRSLPGAVSVCHLPFSSSYWITSV